MLTTIRGTVDKVVINRAVEHYVAGLLDFINPEILKVSKRDYFIELAEMREVIAGRMHVVVPQITDILWSINQRAKVLKSSDYTDLANYEKKLWAGDLEPDFEVGIRACVDAGLTREAIAGAGAHLGRSLAGDDELIYVPELGGFRLMESVMKKKLIHAGRGGKKKFLEILIEHTECGRRGQMISNLSTKSSVTHNFDLVFNNISSLVESEEMIEQIKHIWSKKMIVDGGVWAGMWVKKAQKQAYEAIKETELVVPIMLYDKMFGNVWVGVDQTEVLLDPLVIREGGLTGKALHALERDGKVWSMNWATKDWDKELEPLTKYLGRYNFTDLQNNWLEVKRVMIEVTEKMWQLYDAGNIDLSEFLKKSGIVHAERTLERRYIHQLFRIFAYRWVLDTETRGNMPGKHMEDHLASGESAVLGVKEHLPLGQGGLQVPTATEFFTGRSVLLHSTPGKEGRAIVVLMKHDTSEQDINPLSGEETQRAMDDFAELLKLWPYIVVGDLVPIVVVRNKQYLGISRLALSIVLAFGDVVQLSAREKSLAKIVPATNSRGQVVMVAANEILKAGILAGDDLVMFRSKVVEVADNYSNAVVQEALKTVIN